jgi:hypothetical protein
MIVVMSRTLLGSSSGDEDATGQTAGGGSIPAAGGDHDVWWTSWSP